MKKIIIQHFYKNVKNKKILLKYNKNFCGREGYALEENMKITHNSHNKPDLYGYEMKKYLKIENKSW